MAKRHIVGNHMSRLNCVYRNPTSGGMDCFAFHTCQDNHKNPGPDSVGNLSSASSICSAGTFQHMFSILHLNIQSLTPKIDLVQAESFAYDVMIFSETKLKTRDARRHRLHRKLTFSISTRKT